MRQSLLGITAPMLLGIALRKLAPDGRVTITYEDAQAFGWGEVSLPVKLQYSADGSELTIEAWPKEAQ